MSEALRNGGKNPGRRHGSARRRILHAAAARFYADGIAATGIDAITSDAGVAKMSLYNNFASKADLVEAYIAARHDEWLALHEARRSGARTPLDRVLAVFDAYIDHAELGYAHGFRGCGLLNAAAELSVGEPGREAVRRHKEEVEAILLDPLRELTGESRAAETAEHCSFLLEGAVARAGLEGGPSRLQHARALAERLVTALPAEERQTRAEGRA
ncbi:TetR/AcrR family transcriptional regulator [Leucobacter sp. GX0328]